MADQSRSDDVIIDVDEVRRFARAAFEWRGARPEDAEVVADELVLADRSGVASHGVVRVLEYLGAIDAGKIRLDADVTVVHETGAVAALDGGGGFGPVVGIRALELAERMASETGVGLVAVRNSHHIGRIGSLCEAGASRGYLVLALVAVGIPGVVAPFGGRERRLGTNPIAYGVPNGDRPIVADFATAAMPEGVIGLARQQGSTLPPGVLVDAAGNPTQDPGDLYADPPGAILPFGGPWGHRGFALNLMVELFAGTLAGYGSHDPTRPSNCMFLVVVDPSVALPDGDYAALVADTAGWVGSAEPAVGGRVMLPGAMEADARAAHETTVPLAASTVERLDAFAASSGIPPLRRS